MLIQTLRDDLLTARKARTDTIKINLLTTLVGEASMIGKNAGRETTNDEVVATIKKFIKNAREVLAVKPEALEASMELEILEAYLPKQLSEADIAAIIKALPDSSNMGVVQKTFAQNYKGLYDGAQVKRIWTQIQPS